jgi:hypothetical protein
MHSGRPSAALLIQGWKGRWPERHPAAPCLPYWGGHCQRSRPQEGLVDFPKARLRPPNEGRRPGQCGNAASRDRHGVRWPISSTHASRLSGAKRLNAIFPSSRPHRLTIADYPFQRATYRFAWVARNRAASRDRHGVRWPISSTHASRLSGAKRLNAIFPSSRPHRLTIADYPFQRATYRFAWVARNREALSSQGFRVVAATSRRTIAEQASENKGDFRRQ